MVAIGLLNYLITLSCLTGLGLSIYSYAIEKRAEENDGNYEAMCDISEHISCSKVFHTKYGRGFGFVADLLGEDSIFNKPNSLAGVLAYSLLATLAQSRSIIMSRLSLFFIIMSNILSLYLAYILYFVLYNLCVVCVATYVVNFVNLILTYIKLKELYKMRGEKKKLKKN